MDIAPTRSQQQAQRSPCVRVRTRHNFAWLARGVPPWVLPGGPCLCSPCADWPRRHRPAPCGRQGRPGDHTEVIILSPARGRVARSHTDQVVAAVPPAPPSCVAVIARQTRSSSPGSWGFRRHSGERRDPDVAGGTRQPSLQLSKRAIRGSGPSTPLRWPGVRRRRATLFGRPGGIRRSALRQEEPAGESAPAPRGLRR